MRYILILSLFLISCKQENRKEEIRNSDSAHSQKKYQFQVNFPDTVYVNEKNDGTIVFKSPIDTITESFSDPEQDRYVIFRTLPNNAYNFLNEQFNDSLKEYRIGAIDNRTIPFYDLTFEKTGTYEIEGLINDQVLIGPNTRFNKNKEDFRLVEKDFPVSFKVIVIDSIQKNNNSI
ncbi:hypothetical protein L1I30_14265 [Gillisia sp. M10.2A]|uniref:Lipoprotein n=1 Tax=Gillisia lutea TaxID=2909668 RepID=A0ABS9ELR5_9FLAO|nr:hypothetical protein [Gillisia lutea]MCF4102839.1 hypothetical protein [Gillisia lutea]